MFIETSTVLYFAGKAAFDFFLSFLFYMVISTRAERKRKLGTYKYIEHRVIKDSKSLDVGDPFSVSAWKEYLDLLETKHKHPSLFESKSYDYSSRLESSINRLENAKTTVLEVSKNNIREKWFLSGDKCVNENDYRYATTEELTLFKNMINVANTIEEDLKQMGVYDEPRQLGAKL